MHLCSFTLSARTDICIYASVRRYFKLGHCCFQLWLLQTRTPFCASTCAHTTNPTRVGATPSTEYRLLSCTTIRLKHKVEAEKNLSAPTQTHIFPPQRGLVCTQSSCFHLKLYAVISKPNQSRSSVLSCAVVLLLLLMLLLWSQRTFGFGFTVCGFRSVCAQCHSISPSPHDSNRVPSISCRTFMIAARVCCSCRICVHFCTELVRVCLYVHKYVCMVSAYL